MEDFDVYAEGTVLRKITVKANSKEEALDIVYENILEGNTIIISGDYFSGLKLQCDDKIVSDEW